MKEFSIETLARIIGAEPVENAGLFTGVSVDSRTIKPGDCFFAISGENFDGADFLADVFIRGAVYAVVNKNSKFKIQNSKFKTILKVNDTVKAIGQLAGEYRRQMGFKVVAITGSVGKTTTRQIAYHVLSQHFRVVAAPKNFNNDIGLPLTLLGADPEDEIVIAELGSNHPGEIAYLTRIAGPDIAVIANVHSAHLEGFGDLEIIVQEKLSISEGLQPGGTLIINADMVKWLNGKWLNNHQSPITNYQIMTFGESKDCDVQARNITFNSFGSRFAIDDTEVALPLPGAGNVGNALAAWSVCSRFGITIDNFARTVKTVPAVPMRTELLQIGRLTVLNDCYNANPASMKNALGILVNLGSAENRRLVFICGDMAELGRQTEQLHVELGDYIAQAKVQLLLVVGEFAKIAAETAKRSAEYDLQIESFEDTISACNNLAKFIKDYDIILVKGSRVAKMEIVVEKLKELFS
jgi:UDP-N-acetylmuramoyl-tripeptide--D-alanyl-D-alanine ligase